MRGAFFLAFAAVTSLLAHSSYHVGPDPGGRRCRLHRLRRRVEPRLHAEWRRGKPEYGTSAVHASLVSKAEGPLATLVLPSATGGTNWPGGSSIPRRTCCTLSRKP